MTNIFSSKTQAIADLKADNVKLQQSVTDLTAKLEGVKDNSQDLDSLKQELAKEREGFQSVIDTMKAEFSTEVNTLKQQVADITKAKVEVETNAKVEVEAAKEVKKEELQEKVLEGVAAKMATMGLTEATLPPISQKEYKENIRIIRYNEVTPA